MSHKPINQTRRRQQGNIIVISVFIVVVMGLLAANLVRINWSNQDTLTREALGTQAWFLANSANEWALATLYPIDGDGSLSELETNCTSVNNSANAASALANGLPCDAPTIQCIAPNSALPDELKYYKVSSSASCSSGTVFEVQRMQDVWIKAVE
jgi:MSHA biogenesis protein MshP